MYEEKLKHGYEQGMWSHVNIMHMFKF